MRAIPHPTGVKHPWSMSKIPPLSALRAFEASARLGSHRRAADELCLDHTVISKHIRKLEAELGAQLLTTTPTGTALTAIGKEYYREIAEALSAIASATLRIREQSIYPTLHVACSPGFAVRWLAPRISLFLEANPAVEIALRPTSRPPSLRGAEADIDIRYTDYCQPENRSLSLALPRVFPVASPQWLARNPPCTRISDLLSATLVHEETHEHWRLWLRQAGLEVNEMPHGARYWNAALALDAARMGNGVALANDYIAADDLASGHLVEILETQVRIHPYLFMARANRWEEPLICAFREWIAGHFMHHAE
jgi:LysR family glycine cleavage system transcriptional activator